MTVCDACKKPRNVSFPVYPYRIDIVHENLPQHTPKATWTQELCEGCANKLIDRIMFELRRTINEEH